MADDLRNDQAVQEAAQSLFEGVVPERHQELKSFWATYQPRFNLLTDAGPEGLFVMDGGLYREVRFNHRAMRAFWLAAYIGWEGYLTIYKFATTGSTDFQRFDSMVATFFLMLSEADPSTVPLPTGVPEPGLFPDAEKDAHGRVAAELATFATGWALLHEVCHIKHQQDNAGVASDAQPIEKHDEELSCDEFATTFIIEKADDYALQEEVDAEKVRQKRELGVYFAMFAMTLIGAEHWDPSDSHPAMQARIDAAIEQMGGTGTRISDAIAHAAFAGLWHRWPEAPSPFKL